jgi:hypothetical protein
MTDLSFLEHEAHPLGMANATREKCNKLRNALSATTAQYQRIYHSSPERAKEAYLTELQVEIADYTQQIKDLEVLMTELDPCGLIRE